MPAQAPRSKREVCLPAEPAIGWLDEWLASGEHELHAIYAEAGGASLGVGSFPNPEILVVDGGLERHEACYDRAGRVVRISRALVQRAREDGAEAWKLAVVLLEEFDHQVDHLLRSEYSSVGGDSPLDEGVRVAYGPVNLGWAEQDRARFATYYRVKDGDTLESIARQAGITWQELAQSRTTTPTPTSWRWRSGTWAIRSSPGPAQAGLHRSAHRHRHLRGPGHVHEPPLHPTPLTTRRPRSSRIPTAPTLPTASSRRTTATIPCTSWLRARRRRHVGKAIQRAWEGEASASDVVATASQYLVHPAHIHANSRNAWVPQAIDAWAKANPAAVKQLAARPQRPGAGSCSGAPP